MHRQLPASPAGVRVLLCSAFFHRLCVVAFDCSPLHPGRPHPHVPFFPLCSEVPGPDRAMAMIRPGAALIETAGGLSDQYHEWITVTGYPGLLTITKECKERKYRGMTACLFAPLARVHAASGPGCQTVQYCLALRLSNGVRSAE